jgi:hypothetical protein
MSDPRAETRLSRLICRRQASVPRKGPDLRFGKPGHPQRSQDSKFGGGFSAGSELQGVIGVFTVGESRKVLRHGKLSHPTEKLGFAEVAPVDRIRDIFRLVQFGGA